MGDRKTTPNAQPSGRRYCCYHNGLWRLDRIGGIGATACRTFFGIDKKINRCLQTNISIGSRRYLWEANIISCENILQKKFTFRTFSEQQGERCRFFQFDDINAHRCLCFLPTLIAANRGANCSEEEERWYTQIRHCLRTMKRTEIGVFLRSRVARQRQPGWMVPGQTEWALSVDPTTF